MGRLSVGWVRTTPEVSAELATSRVARGRGGAAVVRDRLGRPLTTSRTLSSAVAGITRLVRVAWIVRVAWVELAAVSVILAADEVEPVKPTTLPDLLAVVDRSRIVDVDSVTTFRIHVYEA